MKIIFGYIPFALLIIGTPILILGTIVVVYEKLKKGSL